MTQPPKGPGALPLLLRLSMLRSRQRGGGSLAERGYALAVALIASFVLLLGVGALASRSQLGFVGQVFQVQNRQARDVAESAIAEFANTLNREPNRHILIAGDSTSVAWDAATNSCTQYNDGGTKISNNPLPIAAADRDRFLPAGGAQILEAGDPSRTFVVELVEYLREDRTSFTSSDGAFLDDIRNGGNRTLIRVTVLGQVARNNNRTSTARVAREFEVVPKCCKRSFGSQGARNWGRDSRSCDITQTPGGGRGILGSLNGSANGWPNSSANQKDIRDENGNLITQAICWDGNGGVSPSILDGNPDPACSAGTLVAGNPSNNNNTGISFAPSKFGLTLPLYAPAGSTQDSAGYNVVPIPTTGNSANRSRYVYYDTSANQLLLCQLSGSTAVSDCRRLDGELPGSTSSIDPCYTVSSANVSSSPPSPYAEVNCRLRQIDTTSGTLFIDTTAAKINLFFDGSPPASGGYLDQSSQGGFRRVDCRTTSGLNSNPSTTYSTGGSRCTREIPWGNPLGSTQLSFQSLCTSGGSECPQYNASELLNVFATGSGSFNLNGSSNTVGMNIYAPKADLRLNGGGNSVPNFMGRLWADGIDLDGGISIRSLSTLPSFCATNVCPIVGGVPFFDFVARSFTQSSGFGL